MNLSLNRKNVMHIVFACLLAASLNTARAEVDTGGTELDLNRLASAQRDHYHGRYSQAIARLTALIEHSPGFAEAVYTRARYNADAGRFAAALADADRVDAFHPDAIQTAILRVEIALRQHNAKAALDLLAHAARLSPLSFWRQPHEGDGNGLEGGYVHAATVHTISYESAYASIAEEMLGDNDAALRNFTNAMSFETEQPWYVLARYCFYAGIDDQFGMAELACNEAIARQTRDIGDYDSLGMVHLKMKAWPKAIADYNLALANRPGFTLSLYGRGIAKHALGDVAGGDADISAARSDEPDIVNIMAQMGVKPI